MADLPNSKLALLERPTLPAIRHVFRGPHELCVRYVKVAEVVLGKLRNAMALGEVDIATRAIRLPDGTRIRVLHDPSSDILYVDTTETTYAPYWEFPYFDFSFIPRKHYSSPSDDEGRAYLLGTETLPLSDDNPNPKRPMWGYHYTSHPYWKGLPDKAEVYQSRSAILWGNQFHFDEKGRNLVSWWHSPGGDLPIPIIRPGDYLATRGTSVFTLDLNGYLTTFDVRDAPPVYTPIHTTIRRQVVLPNGSIAFTLPEFRFGHFTADYRFGILPAQLYRNNRKWEQYDDLLTLIDDVPYIAGYAQCWEKIDGVDTYVSDLLVFPVDTLKTGETTPVVYMVSFSGKVTGYPSAIFELGAVIAPALELDMAIIDQEVSYPWRFNSTGTEAMWIASIGDGILLGAVANVRPVWMAFSIDAKNATLSVIEKKELIYNHSVNSVSTDVSTPVSPYGIEDGVLSSTVTYVPGDCLYGNPHAMEELVHWLSNDAVVSGTDRETSDNRTTIEFSIEMPIAYSYSSKDERIIAYLNEQSETIESNNFLMEDDYVKTYHKRTAPYGYWEYWPHKDQYYTTNIGYIECPPGSGSYSCRGTAEGLRTFDRFLDVYTSYLDQYNGAAATLSSAAVSIVTNNGLSLSLTEHLSSLNVDSVTHVESKINWKTQNEEYATTFYNYYVSASPGCGPEGERGGSITTTNLTENEVDSYEITNEKHDSVEINSTTRILTYANLANGVIEYKEFTQSYYNGMDYVDSVVDAESRVQRNWYQEVNTINDPPTNTGEIYTETALPDETTTNKSINGNVSYELTIKSIILDYIGEESKSLYETTAYLGDASKTVGDSSFTQMTPGYYGNSSSSEDRFFYISRLRQYFDSYSSFSGMVDMSNVEAMRYLYSELHEKAYQMYLHEPVVLGNFFGTFDDQFVVESGTETNTPERNLLLETLRLTENHRTIYPIALVRNRAKVWGDPPARIEKIKA